MGGASFGPLHEGSAKCALQQAWSAHRREARRRAHGGGAQRAPRVRDAAGLRANRRTRRVERCRAWRMQRRQRRLTTRSSRQAAPTHAVSTWCAAPRARGRRSGCVVWPRGTGPASHPPHAPSPSPIARSAHPSPSACSAVMRRAEPMAQWPQVHPAEYWRTGNQQQHARGAQWLASTLAASLVVYHTCRW